MSSTRVKVFVSKYFFGKCRVYLASLLYRILYQTGFPVEINKWLEKKAINQTFTC